jgi:glycosyltransferase involved in cell wall biosynthesis
MPEQTLSLSAVIPAYNEERRLPDTLHKAIAYLTTTTWDWEVRVVDDGSSDGTREVVEAFRKGEPRIVLQAEPHRGKGGALKAGLLAARGDYRFICDADLSMPIHEIARFLPPHLTGADVAIGSREGAGAKRVDEPVLRHLAGRAFNFAVRQLIVAGIQDTQCGFKMFTAKAVEAIFPYVTMDGWTFDIEALHIARRRGFAIREVPIEWHYRPESRVRMLRDGVGMFVELLRIRARAGRGVYDERRGPR